MASLKKSSRCLLAAVCSGVALLGCGVDSLGGPPYEAIVLDRVENGEYALQRRELGELEDFESLQARSFQVFRGGELVVEGRTVQLEGARAPQLRYSLQDGVAVARDYSSLMMISAAYQFGEVFRRLGASTGYEADDFTRQFGVLPVLYEPSLSLNSKGIDVTVTTESNAFFSPDAWVFGIAKRNPRELVPLAASRAVLAHELGHAVFRVSFAEEEKCNVDNAGASFSDPWFAGRLDQEFVFQGINEGFADWVSFAITGIVNSLEVVDVELPRALNVDDFRWEHIYERAKAEQGFQEEVRCQGKYCVGTLFARALYQTFLDEGFDPSQEAERHEFSRTVVSALNQTRLTMKERPFPIAERPTVECNTRDYPLEEFDGPMLGPFFEALLDNFPSETAQSLCGNLADRFQVVFDPAFQGACDQ